MIEKIRANAQMVVDQLRPVSGIDFGFNKESVEWLEGYIDRLRTAGELGNEADQERLISVFGSFLGESITRCYGGQWAQQDGIWGIKFSEGNFAFPFAKVSKQMDNGLEDGIGSFFSVIPSVFRGHVQEPAVSNRSKPWWRFW